MNSICQCLYHITRFRNAPLVGPNISGQLKEVSRAFWDLMERMQAQQSRSPMTASHFRTVVQRRMPMFTGLKADDAFEFLVQLLDVMHRELSVGGDSPIARCFYGRILVRRVFLCGAREEADDQPAFLMVPLPPPGRVPTLAGCFSEWQRSDPPDRDNPLFCPQCRCPEAFTMKMAVGHFADCIIIQLNRFTRGPFGTSKDNRRVEYPCKLDSRGLAEHTAGVYQLVGVVCHQGWEYAGHYTCIVRGPEEPPRWWRISDASVTPIPESSVVTEDAYILFYYRKAEDYGRPPR
jgi:ubiquitin C-terminal hydrolase